MSIFPPGRLLILPSSQALARERERMLEKSGVVLYPLIFTFGRLERVLAEELAPDVEPLSDTGRDMLLGRLLNEMKPAAFGPAAGTGSGLRRRAAEAIEQCRLGGLSPDELREYLKANQAPPKCLALADLYAAYQDALVTSGLTDQAGIRRLIVTRLKNGAVPNVLKDIREILLRGFNRLLPYQVDLIKALAEIVGRIDLQIRIPGWTQNLIMDPDADWSTPFEEVLAVFRGLEALGDTGGNLEPKIVPVEAEQRAPALAWIAEHLFREDSNAEQPPPPDEGLEVFASPGQYAEVEEIGRRIHHLLEEGAPPDSIALVVRDLGEYGELVEDVFRRFRLPLFFRRGAPLNIQAPVRAVMGLLRLAQSPWERERVLDLLASPYVDAGISVDWHRVIRISAEAGVTDDRAGGGWETNLKKLAAGKPKYASDIHDILAGLSRLRARLRLFSPGKELTWTDYKTELISLISDMKLEQRIKESPIRFLHRDAPALAELMDCLEELPLAAEQINAVDAIPIEDLNQTLAESMESRNIGRSNRASSGIMVVNAYDLHGLSFDHVFLAGLNENEFPQPSPENLLLPDEHALNINRAARKRVFTTTAADYRQQELVFYHALTAVRKKATLSYSYSDDRGRPRLASVFLDEVLRLWPEDAVTVHQLEDRAAPLLDQAMTRQELYGRLALDLRKDPEGRAADVLDAVNSDPPERSRWESIRWRAARDDARLEDIDPESVSLPESAITPWLHQIDTYEGWPLVSPNFLQNYAACPFYFWSGTVLGLEEIEEPGDEISPLDEGAIVHEVLQRFLSQSLEAGKLPLRGDNEEWERLVAVLEEVRNEAERSRPLGRTPLWKARLRRIERVLRHWWRLESDATDEFLPARFEWSFGPHAGDSDPDAEPLGAPFLSGGGIFIRGRVDRIDLSTSEARVLDYKNSRNALIYKKMLKDEAIGATSFQAPCYQAAAAEAFGRPAKAGWIVLGDFKATGPHLGPSTDSELFQRDETKRRELLEEGKGNFFNRIEAGWQRMQAGVFAPDPDADICDYCLFKMSCRVNRRGGEESQ